MSRIAIAYTLRWLFIGSCLSLYWWGVSNEIADARRGGDPKHMDWLGAVVLTLPWSLACLAFEPARENDQIWMTAPTIREQSWPIRRTVVRCLAWVEGPAGVRPKGLLC